MIKSFNVTFKNVGQGDSILIDWETTSHIHYGIIDCNLHENQNPLLEEIRRLKVKNIDFIILSHLHYDHYSGLPDLLQHCIDNSIKIKYFLHTFTSDFTKILNLLFHSAKQQEVTVKLLKNIEAALDSDIIETFDNVTINSKALVLSDSVELSFLAPIGKDYLKLSRQRALYENKHTTTIPDLNALSTVISISNSTERILLTSDATRKTVKRLTRFGDNKISKLIQVPHHGSIKNLFEDFWINLKKVKDCPSVYSVGDVKKDKLPNKDVVEFFENNGYFNTSTNFVYGLKEYYKNSLKTSSSVGLNLAPFSKKRPSAPTYTLNDRFNGDQM